MSFQIKSNDRALVVGQTGSGKTNLCEYLLQNANRLVVIDSKGNLKDRFNLQEYNRKSIRALVKNQPVRIQIKQPVIDLNEMPQYYEQIFADLMDAGNITVYIDETSRVTGYSSTVLAQFGAMYTQGRELNKVGVIASVQRPSKLPLIVLTEAQHYFCFRLAMDADRKRMSETMGKEVRERVQHPYGFYYYNYDMKAPAYFSKLRTKTA